MERTYDLVLLGATGHTGKFAAEYITQSFPSDFKWAIAGRTHSKLSNLARDLREINSDRSDPDIEVVQLVEDELHELARKTRVLINTVGPYHLYSEPVLKACAVEGTHYVDVTGETPWVVQMIQKYHEQARSTGAIVSSLFAASYALCLCPPFPALLETSGVVVTKPNIDNPPMRPRILTARHPILRASQAALPPLPPRPGRLLRHREDLGSPQRRHAYDGAGSYSTTSASARSRGA